ncbi:MAG: DUF4424 family protein [Rhizobiales bacterium]|nr:DUF4424 family protein [Hyphomicrobiales bacterium]
MGCVAVGIAVMTILLEFNARMLTPAGAAGLEQMEPVANAGFRLLSRGISMSRKLAFGWVRGVLASALMPVGLAVSASASEHAAGGLVAYEPLSVTLARYDLHISPALIRATYVLQSARPQQATLAFPMPPVPLQGGPDFLGGAEINEGDPRNYMHFTATVNGRAVQSRLVESAYLGEVDVGGMLDAAGLPLILLPDEASALIAALPAEQYYALEEARIVARGGDDPPHFTPLWSFQGTFEWQQTFPPGETLIEIGYRPLADVVENPNEFLQSSTMASRYCLGEGMGQAADDRSEVVTVAYLLAITPFWNGPIREFNLTVERSNEEDLRGQAVLATYCAPGQGQEARMRDFIPTRRLDVAFIYMMTRP